MAGILRICVSTALLLLAGSSAADAQVIKTLFPCSETLDDAVGINTGIVRRSEDFDQKDEIVELMQLNGIKSMRTGIYWDSFIKKDGTTNFELSDPAMESIRGAKIQMVNYLTPSHPSLNAWENVAEFSSYVNLAVSRYRFYCLDWQVFNNIDFLKVKNRRINPSDYYPVLKLASRIIKSSGKGMRVVTAGFTEPATQFLDSLLNYGCLDFVDIVNLTHTGTPEWIVNRSKKLRESMLDYAGRTAPVWMTYSFASNLSSKELKDESLTEKDRAAIVEEREMEQARRLPRAFILGFACGIDRMYWDGFKSLEINPSIRAHYCGLMHSNMSRKPAWKAMETLMVMLPNHSSRPVVRMKGGAYLASWTNFEGKKVWAVWRGKETKAVSLRIEGKARFVDYMGRKLKQKTLEQAGEDLIYILGAHNVEFEGK